MDLSHEKHDLDSFLRRRKRTLKIGVFEVIFKKGKFSIFLSKIFSVQSGKVFVKRLVGFNLMNDFWVVIEP